MCPYVGERENKNRADPSMGWSEQKTQRQSRDFLRKSLKSYKDRQSLHWPSVSGAQSPRTLGLGFLPEERLSPFFFSCKAPGSQGLRYEERAMWEA